MPQRVLPGKKKNVAPPPGKIPECALDKETSLLHYFHPRDCRMTLAEGSGKMFS